MHVHVWMMGHPPGSFRRAASAPTQLSLAPPHPRMEEQNEAAHCGVWAGLGLAGGELWRPATWSGVGVLSLEGTLYKG